MVIKRAKFSYSVVIFSAKSLQLQKWDPDVLKRCGTTRTTNKRIDWRFNEFCDDAVDETNGCKAGGRRDRKANRSAIL